MLRSASFCALACLALACIPLRAGAADPALSPKVKVETSLGAFVLELDGEKAPVSVQNFLRYAQEGFYNDTIFHRVIPTFMIQGGGYTADMEEKKAGLHEPIKNEWKNGLKNIKGTISMARLGGRPDSATAQFFINVVDNPPLDEANDGAAYAVFGKVAEGMEVVDKIRDAKLVKHPKYPATSPVTPDPPVVIKSVTLVGEFDRSKIEARVGEIQNEMKAKEAEASKMETETIKAAVAKAEGEIGKKATVTASGLNVITLKEGEGANPKPTDRVQVHYTGWLLDGTKFDSSVDRGSPATFVLNQVIPGWTEAVGLMKPGGKVKLFIPSKIAYGEPGRPPTIPPNSPLIFEVELQAINPGAAEALKAFDEAVTKAETETKGKAVRTPSGMAYIVLKEGKGRSPVPTDNVEVHYTGWTADGKKFDSSVDRGSPSTFPLNRVIPGWTEGVGLMKPGGKNRLIIPGKLAYGPQGKPPTIPPNATLIFDVELISIK